MTREPSTARPHLRGVRGLRRLLRSGVSTTRARRRWVPRALALPRATARPARGDRPSRRPGARGRPGHRPDRYGRDDPHPGQLDPAWLLDEIELDLARQAVERGVPLLGICRGAQILNVAFGGTLFGDLEEFPGGGADHPGAKWEEWQALVAATLEGDARPPHPSHPVDIATGSILAAHLGERAIVDSYHHQAIRDVGEGLVATAFAPHGTVEAIEMPEATSFVLGVQWELHEEWQDDDAEPGDLEIVRRRGRCPTRRPNPGCGAVTSDRDHDGRRWTSNVWRPGGRRLSAITG